jgi:hypothetical protein
MDRMKIIDKKTGKAKYLVDEENRVIDLEKKDVEVDRKDPEPAPDKEDDARKSQ